MHRTDRTVAPRPGRIAKAAREGLFPHSRALAPGAAMIALGVLLSIAGREWITALADFFEKSIGYAVGERALGGGVFIDTLLNGARLILPVLLIVFAAGTIASLTPVLWSRQRRGQSAVALPAKPNPRLTMTIVRTVGVFAFLLLSLKTVRDAGSSWSIGTGPVDGPLMVGGLILQKLLLLGGAILLLVALIELAVMRTEILRALRLSPRESREEERAAGGDPAIKGEAKRRARRRGSR